LGIIDRLVDQHVRKPARDAVRRAMTQWCPECQKHMPFGHTCVIRTDFKSRRRQAERRTTRRTAGKAAPRARERRAHPYETCSDQGCTRPVCVAFKAGMAACPLEHV
jgi:hypothetical protein